MAPRKKAETAKAMAAVPTAEVSEAPKKAPKKTTGKKAAEKKPVENKTTEIVGKAEEKAAVEKKAEIVTSVYIQYAGKEVAAKDLVAAAKAAYLAAGQKEEEIKTFDVYVKPEENAVYYAVNGEGSDDYKIEY